MKMFLFRCAGCGHEEERLVENDCKFGDADTAAACAACALCYPLAVPCCCPVRTPLNSASFVDCHPDRGDGGRFEAARKTSMLETAVHKAEKQCSGGRKSSTYQEKKAELADWKKHCQGKQEGGCGRNTGRQ